MTLSQLYPVIEQMTDNMMNSVSSADERLICKNEFLKWLSLSYIGGLVDFTDYDEVKQYGLYRIDKEFDEWERLDRAINY